MKNAHFTRVYSVTFAGLFSFYARKIGSPVAIADFEFWMADFNPESAIQNRNLDNARPASLDSGFDGVTDMAIFSVILLTAPPPGQATEAGGAFVKVDGRESLLCAVELFLNRDNIKQVQLVFTPEMLEEGKRKYGGHLSFSGVKVLSAGPKWIDQIIAAGEKISEIDPRHPPRRRPPRGGV